MQRDKIKKVMDACYLAKRVRDLLPKLPNGVTSTHIHYLDTIRKLELKTTNIKVIGAAKTGCYQNYKRYGKTWTC